MPSKLAIFKGLSIPERRTVKKDRALEIMKLYFTMQDMGNILQLNEQDTQRYQELQQQHNTLAKELYQYMKEDKTI
ncbi:unnamed protein product [Adineta steineri]|uniref:Uncharacterized protein n=1 Tax=Adineta steineri TaxID=433720 RepID=A0A814EYJ6_9BILA|nr:unnamed protein product [Adineta steineri]CAF1075628.1 unnamed protein product [Adineta steineri]